MRGSVVGQWLKAAKNFAVNATQEEKAYAGIAGMTISCFLVGGFVWQYAFAGLLTNIMFWWIFNDNQNVIQFLKERGHWVDICITVASFTGAGGTVAGFLTGLMFTAYFTLFRSIFAPPLPSEQVKPLTTVIREWWADFRAEKPVSDVCIPGGELICAVA